MRLLTLATIVVSLIAPASVQAGMLIFSNDIRGELGPCGCSRIRLGGMRRLEEFVKRQKAKHTHVLQLDAGNLLFENDTVPKLLEELSLKKAETTLKAMEGIGLHAFTPGTTDFAMGIDQFLKLTQNSKIRILAINLFKNGKQLFRSHEIFQIDKTRILVIGLVSQKLDYPKALNIKDPAPLIKRQLKTLKGKYDLLVLLSHQGLEEDMKLASKIEGVNAIIGAHSQSFLQTPEKINKTAIFQTSFLNQYIGSVPFKKSFDLSQYKLTPLDEKYDSSKQTSVTKILSSFETYITKVDKEDASVNPIQTPHFQTFATCLDCHDKQFRFWMDTQHFKALQPLKTAKQLRNKSCLQCHTLGLGHPKGFSNLSNAAVIKGPKLSGLDIDEVEKFISHVIKKGENEAIDLHGEKRTFPEQLKRLDKVWAPVQCENCHGPALDHPFSLNYSTKINKNRCLECHTRERAPSWYSKKGELEPKIFRKKLKMIACPSSDK